MDGGVLLFPGEMASLGGECRQAAPGSGRGLDIAHMPDTAVVPLHHKYIYKSWYGIELEGVAGGGEDIPPMCWGPHGDVIDPRHIVVTKP